MIANILILVFLAGMIYWWSSQGMFSAFLHLCMVVVAGSLAFAFWEPAAHAMLSFGPTVAPFAWGLSLGLLFVVILAVIRLASDKLVPMNMQFVPAISQIGGGFLGLISGMLTAGVAWLSLGFMPLPAEIAGIQPYAIDNEGKVVAVEKQLWIKVDRMAARFFSGLSAGAFQPMSGAPLAHRRPDLARLAALHRLHLDENASRVAVPGSVRVERAFSQETAHAQAMAGLDPAVQTELGDPLRKSGNRLIVIDSHWQMIPLGTYDSDSTLRISPVQVRLVALDENARQRVLVAPTAYVMEIDPQAGTRHFYPLDALEQFVATTSQQQKIAWVFITPAEQKPEGVLMRGLYFDLPDRIMGSPEEMVAALGQPAPAVVEAQAVPAVEPEVGAREGDRVGHIADEIVQSARLPRPFSRNEAAGMGFSDRTVQSGSATVEASVGSLADRVRVEAVYAPAHIGVVRVRLQRDQARSLLGAAHAAAASLQGVWLKDDRNQRWLPIAYVLHRSGGQMVISVDLNMPIQSARQLPFTEMQEGDQLYLYFHVPKGLSIVSYHIGNTTQQDITPPLQVR